MRIAPAHRADLRKTQGAGPAEHRAVENGKRSCPTGQRTGAGTRTGGDSCRPAAGRPTSATLKGYAATTHRQSRRTAPDAATSAIQKRFKNAPGRRRSGTAPSSPPQNSRYLRAALFRRTRRRGILNKANALLPVSLLDPTENCSLSLTLDFRGGLLVNMERPARAWCPEDRSRSCPLVLLERYADCASL